MTNKFLLVLAIMFSSLMVFAQADDKRLEEVSKLAKKEAGDGWSKGGGLGFDISGLGLINPKIGAGDNKFGIGGLGTFFFNLKKGKDYWDNGINFQLAAQRFRLNKTQFQKSLDVIRFNSRYGHQIKQKLYGAVDLGVETLLLPTYPGNLLKPGEAGDKKIADLFSPVRITFSPGLDYKHSKHLSIFFAPIGVKMIYVGNDDIAQMGIHGNQLKDENDPSKGYDKMFFQAGANLKMAYNNKYLNEKLSFTSSLDVFSNYLNNPQNMDILWGNSLDIAITKNLSLSLLGELFYDHDIFVNVDRNEDGIYGGAAEGELGHRASMTGAYYLKYNKIF